MDPVQAQKPPEFPRAFVLSLLTAYRPPLSPPYGLVAHR